MRFIALWMRCVLWMPFSRYKVENSILLLYDAFSHKVHYLWYLVFTTLITD
jgi:hypothetical protein